MKVKELIEILNTFDPDKNIWIGYDYPFAICEPNFELFKDSWQYTEDDKVAPEDYIHFAG